jgi:hypothetical protein
LGLFCAFGALSFVNRNNMDNTKFWALPACSRFNPQTASGVHEKSCGLRQLNNHAR